MPTAFHLIIADESPVFVFVVQEFFVRVKRFLLPVLIGRIVLILAVKHLDIAVIDEIPQYT